MPPGKSKAMLKFVNHITEFISSPVYIEVERRKERD